MIKIQGIIGEDVTLTNVIAQAKQEKGGNVTVLIDSPGGIAEEGIAIYKYLKNLQRKVTTQAVNQCGSIASVIFMAGEKRIAGCDIFIHNPFLGNVHAPYLSQEDLEQAAKYLDDLKKQINDIYSSTAGVDKEAIAVLMDQETFISPEDAVRIGIATHTNKPAQPAQPMAYSPVFTTKNQTTNKVLNIINPKTMSKLSYLLAHAANILKGTAKAQEFTDKDGNVLTVDIPADRESQRPEVGDVASPDGTFTLPDETVVTVVDGVVSEVQDPADPNNNNEPTEVDTLNARIAELEAENNTLRSTLEALTGEAEALQAQVNDLQAKKTAQSKTLNLKRQVDTSKAKMDPFEAAAEARLAKSKPQPQE